MIIKLRPGQIERLASLVGFTLAPEGGYRLELETPAGSKHAVLQTADLGSFTRAQKVVLQLTNCHLFSPCPAAEWDAFVGNLIALAHGGLPVTSQPRRLAA